MLLAGTDRGPSLSRLGTKISPDQAKDRRSSAVVLLKSLLGP